MTVVFATTSGKSTRGTDPALRGEEHKEALSGPVHTYKIVEDLMPYNRTDRTRPVRVTLTDNGVRLNVGAAQHVATSKRVSLKYNHLDHTLAITPDDDGPWRLSVVRKQDRVVSAHVGGHGLTRQLEERGVALGRYPARLEGDSVIVECGGGRNR